MSPNKGETAAHGCCHCWGDMVMRMRKSTGHTAVGTCASVYNLVLQENLASITHSWGITECMSLVISNVFGNSKQSEDSWQCPLIPAHSSAVKYKNTLVLLSFVFSSLLSYPGSRGPFSKYLGGLISHASLMWLRREPSVSISKKYPLEARVLLSKIASTELNEQ